jgi:hypothetical protein
LGIFEDVIVSVKTAADVAYKKTGEVIDVSKIRLNIAEISKEICNNYEILGKLCYENQKSGEIAGEEAEKIISKIDSLLLDLKDKEAKLSQMRNKVKCQNCGNDNEPNYTFCSKCGTKLECKDKEKPQPIPEVEIDIDIEKEEKE